ncbi:MAG: NYN domain-containing protein [Defluviitaleaceae bacterium]|nr:NYN domain-containing protein [Defluviitaleaceae bacterium]
MAQNESDGFGLEKLSEKFYEATGDLVEMGADSAEPEERYPDAYKRSTYLVVSQFAYLIGIPLNIFMNETTPPKMEIYKKLSENKNARIIRNLCMLRNAFEKKFLKILNKMKYEYMGISQMPELLPVECITELSYDGIHLRNTMEPNQYVVEFNSLISDRINNCKDIFPIWLNWSYIKDLFIMPNGTVEEGIKKAAAVFYENWNYYPYQVYMNWTPSDNGNILFNDKKFVTLLYSWNNDAFTDFSKITDASARTKNNIYEFIEKSNKTVFVVDCENSNPYKLCATINGLDQTYLNKIAKIILIDDINAVAAWQTLGSFVSIPIEYVLIERIKQNKSLVDIKLTTEVCKEFYENSVDSFILVSSDSDYWGLISSVTRAKFLVMVEFEKTGPDIKNALVTSGIFYCYIDDFYSGESDRIVISALLNEAQRYLDQYTKINLVEMVDSICKATRIDMAPAERKQFFDKHIRTLNVEISKTGEFSIQLKRPSAR